MSIKLKDLPMEMFELDSDELKNIVGGLSLAVAGDTSMQLYLRPPTLMERINCAEHGTSC
ncbi:MAG: hypothetical protein ACR2P1_10405 [Pseudomonadales bacterium]